jgi:glutathione S-transferase
MVSQILVEGMIKPVLGQPADEVVAQSGARRLRKSLAVLEAQMGNAPFLAGKSLSLADLYLIPMRAYFVQTPEGKAATPTLPCLEKWWQTIRARPSVVNTTAVVQ